MWVTTVDEITGCSRKNCTKFTTILQPCTTELRRFQQNVQKENVYTTKASVWIRQLNILCFSWQVNYLKTAQSTCWQITFCFHTGIYTIILAVKRRLHGKKSFHPRTKKANYWSCSESDYVSSNACMHSTVSVCLSATVKDWMTRCRNTLSCKSFLESWQFSQLKNVKFQSLLWSPVDSYSVLLGCKLSHPTRCLTQFSPNDDDHYQAAFQLDP